MIRVLLHCIFVVGVCLVSAGCGTVTPDFQEFWGSSDDVSTRKIALIHQVRCELGLALESTTRPRKEKWERYVLLDNWAADVLMQLTIEEKSTVSPSVSINALLPNAGYAIGAAAPISVGQTFSTALGGTGSSDGYRQEKVHLPYSAYELMQPFEAYTDDKLASTSCVQKQPSPGFVIDMQDLKIGEFIRSSFAIDENQQGDFARVGKSFADKGVISDDVKFEVVSSGSVNPTWKLLRTAGNTSSTPFLSASRDRTQELIITLGPIGERFVSSVNANEIAGAINATRLNNP